MRLKLMGMWTIIHKDRWGRILDIEKIKNLITDQGVNYIMDAGMHGSTPISAWYMAPWSASHTPAAGNTYATPGYTEANAQYDEATRQEWVEGAASSKVMTNASAAVITANTDVTIYGIGLVGGGSAPSTKGNTAGGGTLFACTAFGSSKSLSSAETLSITYTLTGADA
jgi:hypothetical protein